MDREIELSVKCVNGAVEGIEEVLLSVHLHHAHSDRRNSPTGPYDTIIDEQGGGRDKQNVMSS